MKVDGVLTQFLDMNRGVPPTFAHLIIYFVDETNTGTIRNFQAFDLIN